MSQRLKFHKSSYSGRGQDCVEVAQIPAAFRKSSYSGQDANCVEVADLPSAAAIRDSEHPENGHLTFSTTEWAAFLTTSLTR
ncbi:DUF397 domain-containing protein [Nocardiopsis alba]|uniref:DUF397 domain-containing protein n=2 Tax=Nocardiopsis alba TaxID=53437 RepID=A0ABV5DUF9_9ACTN|nr:DUF397 domain-containing protein [Nocardiopsis alba]AFR09376.1 hypothetical protein B005_0812 [Nocardiopsis alba ATCC BAA-2165]